MLQLLLSLCVLCCRGPLFLLMSLLLMLLSVLPLLLLLLVQVLVLVELAELVRVVMELVKLVLVLALVQNCSHAIFKHDHHRNKHHECTKDFASPRVDSCCCVQRDWKPST